MSMLPEYPSDPIAYLVRRKFGDATLTGTVSGLLEDEEETQARLHTEIQTYRDELQGLEEQELIARAYQEREKETVELEDLEEQFRFFSQPNAQADFEYWCKFPLWTLDEAVALTLGKDPKIVTWSKIEEHAETSPFAARFANLYRFVLRARDAQQISELVSPTDYIAWAKANKVELPPELATSVQAFSDKVPDWKALYEGEKLLHASTRDELEHQKAANGPLSENERNSLYKMILGMAVAVYRHDPSASRNTTSGTIVEDLHALNISINEDTVRKWLQRAADEFGYLLPDDKDKQR